MKSPPGGGMRASPKRASSGPASRNEARIRAASPSSTSVSVTASACRRSSFSPLQCDLHAKPLEQRDLGLGVADPRHVGEHDLLVGEQAGGEDRERRVLVARGDDLARERGAALDDELLHRSGRLG